MGASSSQASARRRRVIKRSAKILGALFVGLAILSSLLPGPVRGDLELVRSERAGLRVLFVGNRLVSQNSMITMLRDLAAQDAGATPIFAVRYASAASTLERAARDEELTRLLAGERWDYVVLQEHSQTVSRPGAPTERTLPAALALDAMARRVGARTVLLVQGGYEDGDEKVDGDTYDAMQRRVTAGYLYVNRTLRAMLAPVGSAWAAALREQRGLDLWHSDGIRPSEEGSYLMACVVYALLSQRDPVNSRFTAGLDSARARSLREIARRAVADVYGRPPAAPVAPGEARAPGGESGDRS